MKKGLTAIEALFYVICTVRPPVMGGHLGSWMATKDASLNAAENDFPIEIRTSYFGFG